MRTFLLIVLLFICTFSAVTSQKVVEMSGNFSDVIGLLQAVLAASQRENINQRFRVRTVDGNIIMESDDYKPGALEHLN